MSGRGDLVAGTCLDQREMAVKCALSMEQARRPDGLS